MAPIPKRRSERSENARNVFHNKFHDNCQLHRKSLMNKKDDEAIMPTSIMPLYSARQKITEPYSGLFDAMIDESRGNEWINDAKNKIMENGNKGQMIESLEKNALGSEAKNSESEIVSPMIIAREFIGRQLTGIGTKPEKVQATFSTGAAMLLVSNVVSESDWREFGPEICQELGWSFNQTLMFRYLLCEAARRMGKTRFISMTAVNFALSRPGSTVIVFSTSQDASTLLRTDVENMLEQAGEMEFAGKFYKLTDLKGELYGQKMIELRSPYDMTKVSKIYFKPGLHKHNMDKQVCCIYILIFY